MINPVKSFLTHGPLTAVGVIKHLSLQRDPEC